MNWDPLREFTLSGFGRTNHGLSHNRDDDIVDICWGHHWG